MQVALLPGPAIPWGFPPHFESSWTCTIVRWINCGFIPPRDPFSDLSNGADLNAFPAYSRLNNDFIWNLFICMFSDSTRNLHLLGEDERFIVEEELNCYTRRAWNHRTKIRCSQKLGGISKWDKCERNILHISCMCFLAFKIQYLKYNKLINNFEMKFT